MVSNPFFLTVMESLAPEAHQEISELKFSLLKS